MFLPSLQPLHHQHNNNEQVRRPHLRQGEEPITCTQSAELQHPLKITHQTWHPRRTENNPPDDCKEKRQQHLPSLLEGREDAPFGHLVGVLAVLARQYQRQKQNGVVCAPSNEGPIRTVPETRQQEDDEGVPDDFRLRDTTAAQGDVDVIPEPSRQGDVPTTPKFSNVTTEIRHVEVPHQFNSKQLGRAYSNVGIAREVAVDLEGEKDGSKKQGASCLFRVSRENLVHIHRAIVRHHYLLEQAPQDLAHTVNGSVVIEFSFLQELRQEVSRPLDGASHQLWEKRNEGEKGDNILGRLNLASVNIDGITQGLEGVE